MTVFQIPALLFMAANVSPDMEDSWSAFTLAILWISVVQFLQYLLAYTKHKHSEKDIKLIKDFLWLLFIRSVVIVISLFIPGTGGILLTGFGFILSILGSSLFRKDMAMVPINMPHLIERLTLFTIITLGEMLMAAANFFELEKFSINSVLLMLQVVALFLFYISEFDQAIEENIPCQSGAELIYKHYFIWFGLNICTVDLDYANDAMGIIRVIMMFLGLFLFYLGVLSNSRLNKKSHQLDKKIMIPFVLIYILGLGSSIVFQSNIPVTIVLCTLTIILETVLFLTFVVRRFSKKIREEIICP